MWTALTASGWVRHSRSLSPRRSLGWSRNRSPRNAASSKACAWSIVPIAPSRTRIRSPRSSSRRARRVARVNGGAGAVRSARGTHRGVEVRSVMFGLRYRASTRRCQGTDSDDLIGTRVSGGSVPYLAGGTCPDLAPCRRRVGRLSWLRRAGPSATLDKSPLRLWRDDGPSASDPATVRGSRGRRRGAGPRPRTYPRHMTDETAPSRTPVPTRAIRDRVRGRRRCPRRRR